MRSTVSPASPRDATAITFEAFSGPLSRNGVPVRDGSLIGRSLDRAADILYALVSVEVYHLYVVERHWTADEWKVWALAAAARCLFPNAAATGDDAPVPQGG